MWLKLVLYFGRYQTLKVAKFSPEDEDNMFLRNFVIYLAYQSNDIRTQKKNIVIWLFGINLFAVQKNKGIENKS
jgi:hypothetical protein